MFGFGRLTHLAFDLVAITALMAGVKKSTGFAPHTSLIKDPSIRGFFESYFGLGDRLFGMLCGYVVNSSWFRRSVE